MSNSLIEMKNLQVRKKNKLICQVTELRFEPGQRINITGENGSGKTTLLKVLAGLERNFSGTLTCPVPVSQRVYVHQNPLLFQGTVLDNVTYSARARKVSRKVYEQRAVHLLAQLGISQLINTDQKGLSGGERKRVAIARALMAEPQMLLLDEPFAEVDKPGITAINHLLENTTCTLLISTPQILPQRVDQTLTLKQVNILGG